MRRGVCLALTAVLGVSSVAAGQTPAEVRRLAALGRVWGFLKYFHPGVAAGPIHWDSVVMAAVPRARAARTNTDLNAVLGSLLDAAGEARPCPTCEGDAPDSVRMNVDLRWLTDSTLFSAVVSRRLAYVRDNRHRGSSRYVSFGFAPVFDADSMERTRNPSEQQRLLALFRFWNAIQYYYPHLYVNGGDWTIVLEEFIPRVVAATDAAAFQLTVLELSARLHDSHVQASGMHISRTLGLRLPAFDARWIDGRAVVWRVDSVGGVADSSRLRVGDVITHVDGESMAKRRETVAKYVAAGNPASFEYRLLQAVLGTRARMATYVIDRGGATRTLTLPTAERRRPQGRPLADVASILPQGNIGYVDLGGLERSQIDSAIAIVRNTDGTVLDLRHYPRQTAWRLAELLFPVMRPFATATLADSTYPAQVRWVGPALVGPRRPNADAYRGRLAILVDERTMSQGEYSAMALRTSPESRVIGSQTAGADGNVTSIGLPGMVLVYFTGAGVYYPDGRPTQRVGIVPDIEVRPTLRGVSAGRDEVLDRAIQYLQSGR